MSVAAVACLHAMSEWFASNGARYLKNDDMKEEIGGYTEHFGAVDEELAAEEDPLGVAAVDVEPKKIRMGYAHSGRKKKATRANEKAIKEKEKARTNQAPLRPENTEHKLGLIITGRTVARMGATGPELV